MAKFTPGSIISQVSGKLAGSVFSRGKSKAVIRQRVVGKRKTNLQKNSIAVSQARVISFARNWRTLTEAQRTAWSEMAIKFPTTDKLGQPTVLTGLQLYTKQNAGRAMNGLAATTTPIQPARVRSVNITSVNIVAGVSFTVTFTLSQGFDVVNWFIRASRPVSAGRSSIRPTELKLIIPPTSFIFSGLSLQAGYTLRQMSTAGKQGMKIFVSFQPAGFVNGVMAKPVIASGIIT
jgi:hypothetical protein